MSDVVRFPPRPRALRPVEKSRPTISERIQAAKADLAEMPPEAIEIAKKAVRVNIAAHVTAMRETFGDEWTRVQLTEMLAGLMPSEE